MTKKHQINIEALKDAYSKEQSGGSDGWHVCRSTHDGTIETCLAASATSTRHGFKFHISIHPDDIEKGALLIAEAINNSEFPNDIGIKFSSRYLAHLEYRQPAKQVAFASAGSGEGGILTEQDVRSFMQLLELIGKKLVTNLIRLDPKPLNSDNRIDKQNRALPIAACKDNSHFSYRYENFSILDDKSFHQRNATGKNCNYFTIPAGVHPPLHAFVKLSYMEGLDPHQRYNPLKLPDPFQTCQLFEDHTNNSVKAIRSRLASAVSNPTESAKAPVYIKMLTDLGTQLVNIMAMIASPPSNNHTDANYAAFITTATMKLKTVGCTDSDIKALKDSQVAHLRRTYQVSGGSKGRTEQIFGPESQPFDLVKVLETLQQRVVPGKQSASAQTLFAVSRQAKKPTEHNTSIDSKTAVSGGGSKEGAENSALPTTATH